MAEQRITQVSAEVLHAGAPNVRATELAAEVLRIGPANVRATEVAVEVLRSLAFDLPIAVSDYFSKFSIGNRTTTNGSGVVLGYTTNFEGEFSTTWAHAVDGDRATGPSRSTAPTAGSSHVTFQFEEAFVLDAILAMGGDNNNYGTWKVYGSNDGSIFDDLGNVSWQNVADGANVMPDQNTNTNGCEMVITNSTAYSYYRLEYVSGWVTGGRMCYELLFRTIHSPYDGGSRDGWIQVSVNMTENSGRAPSKFVDGQTLTYKTDTQDLYYPTLSTSPASFVRFQFPEPVIMRDSVFTKHQNGAISVWGTWKWQRSSDGSTWVDEGSTFTFNDPAIERTANHLPDPGGSTPAEYWQLLCTDATRTNLTFIYDAIFNLSMDSPDGNAAGAALTVGVTLDPGSPADANVAGATLTVTSSLIAGTAEEFIPVDGATITATASVATSGIVSTSPIDGGKIYEFSASQVAAEVYQEVNYDSIWGRGDRVANGLLNTGQYGWSIVFVPMAAAFNGSFGIGLGDGPALEGDAAGNSAWFSTVNGEGLDLRGITFEGGEFLDDFQGMWALFGGTSAGIYSNFPYTAGIDAFNNNQITNIVGEAGFTLYKTEIAFEPRVYVPFPHYEFVYIAGVRTDLRFCNELYLKVAHSNLDGGDRRPTADPAKRVAFSMSSHFTSVGVSGPFETPQQALFDGVPPHYQSKKISGLGSSANVNLSVTTVGASLQFVFPRPVKPNYLLFVNYNNNKEVYSGANPTKFGKWHWEYSTDSGASWIAIGSTWWFRDDCVYMIAPNTSGNFGLPDMADGGASHWRMVLDEGPAFGNGYYFSQIMFDLYDVTGLAPPLEIAFSDDVDGFGVTATIGPPGSPYVVAFSDGGSDGITFEFTNTPNPLLSVSFDDGATFDTWSDLYPSVVVQTVLVTTGR